MSARIDHAAEALRVIAEGEDAARKAKEQARGGNPTRADNYGKKAHGCWAQAQVHATLALAEQQRIANVISLMQMQAEIDENTELLAGEALHSLIDYRRTPATPFSDPDDQPVIRPEIREAMGLS